MNWRVFAVFLLVIGFGGLAGGLIWASMLGASFDECEMTNSMRDIQGTLNGVSVRLDECRGPGVAQVIAAVGGVFGLVGLGLAISSSATTDGSAG